MLRLFPVLLFLGCGGGPAASPDVDPSGDLPADAPLVGRLHPEALVGLLDELAARRAEGAAGRVLRTVLSPSLLSSLGVEPGAPVGVALRSGPVLGILRASEDVARVFETGEDLQGWLGSHPLPPTWLHVRVVGRPADGDPEAALGERFGSLLVTRAGEPLAPALDGAAGTLPERTLLFRLLAADPPAIVRVERRPGRTVIDLVQDQGLGGGALAAGYAALGAPSAPPLAAGPPALAELRLQHRAWDEQTQALGMLAALRPLIDPGTDPRRARDLALSAAARSAALLAAGAHLFEGTTVRVVRDHRGLHVALRAHYAARGMALAGLRGGVSPVGHATVRRLGRAALSFAAAPGWRAALDAVAEPAALPAPAFFGEVLRCGPPCYPALWTGLPALGVAMQRNVATLLPLTPERLPTGLDAALTRGGWAAALQFEGPPGPDWERAFESVDFREGRRSGTTSLRVFGSDGAAVRELGRGSPQRSGALVELSADLDAEESAAFAGVSGALRFADDAMEIDLDLRLRAPR